ncbi:MAG TPA: HIT family protein [Thermoplasmata archaeon]|nr:HIT family protein [Thermoplasmata archaeon]
MAADCIFCKIIRREVPASIVREDADTLAFMDIRPMNSGHVLVIPKTHAVLLEELPGGGAGRLFEATRAVSGALRRAGIRCEAVSLYVADGREAGQEVPHVHVHAIPRFAGDGFGLRVTPGYGRIAPRDELEQIAGKIRQGLGASGP